MFYRLFLLTGLTSTSILTASTEKLNYFVDPACSCSQLVDEAMDRWVGVADLHARNIENSDNANVIFTSDSNDSTYNLEQDVVIIDEDVLQSEDAVTAIAQIIGIQIFKVNKSRYLGNKVFIMPSPRIPPKPSTDAPEWKKQRWELLFGNQK